jgi:hypothetical protein
MSTEFAGLCPHKQVMTDLGQLVKLQKFIPEAVKRRAFESIFLYQSLLYYDDSDVKASQFDSSSPVPTGSMCDYVNDLVVKYISRP